VGGEGHTAAALFPGKRPGAHCTQGLMGNWAGLDGCRQSRHLRHSISGPPNP